MVIRAPTGDGFEQNEFGGRVFVTPSCYPLPERHLDRFKRALRTNRRDSALIANSSGTPTRSYANLSELH